MGTWPPARELALLLDLYELTMIDAYLREGLRDEAVFSLFVRRLPARRNFLVAAGLSTALELLEELRFSPEALEYLDSLDRFSPELLRWLEGFHFSGSVRGVAEGTPLFELEPLLEVRAPLPEAQLVETLLMNQVHLQTLAASKAVRVALAAGERPVIDFGARRMHGADAAVKVARAAYLAGVASTSNLLAGRLWDVPVAGTMAHAFVQAYPDELSAFRAFARAFPDTVLLVDTYDTLRGVERVIALAKELGDDFRVQGVRLDSGDLGALAFAARKQLDEAGLSKVRIVASGGLDEDSVARLVRQGAPIDAFGVGTAMGVSADEPSLDMAYKLVEFRGEGRMKLSAGKALLPGPKQVFRRYGEGKDVLATADETDVGRPLLEPVMSAGRRLDSDTLEAERRRLTDELARLPPRLRELTPASPPYPVEVSAQLREAGERLANQLSAEG